MPVRPLIAQVGGPATVRAILDDLYARLFDDPMVGFLFAGHDRARIVEMQLAFTRRMLGDDVSYDGRSIPDAHEALPILPGHFDRRHHLLREVLVAHRVPDEAREAWLMLDQGLRTAVLKVGRRRIDDLNERGGEGG